MAKSSERGTKRTCQSSSCGARFYDLSRDPIVCPMCGTEYRRAVAPVAALAATAAAAQRRPARKPEFVAPGAVTDAPEAEAEDALVDVEEGGEAIEADDAETFLEEEDEGGDVTGIIGGTPAEGDEEV